MTWSIVVGTILVLLGGLCVIEAMVLATVEALRPKQAGAFPVKELLKFGELVKGILESFGKLTVVGQFLIVGLALVAGGTYVLADRPF